MNGIRVILLSGSEIIDSRPAHQRIFGISGWLRKSGFEVTVCAPYDGQVVQKTQIQGHSVLLVPKRSAGSLKGRIKSSSGAFLNKLSFTLQATSVAFGFYGELTYFVDPDTKRHFDYLKPKCIIASGPKFEIFNVAKSISNEYSVPWLMDYRDEWSTSSVGSRTQQILRRLGRWREKILLRHCCCFVSVSSGSIERIRALTKHRGVLLENGFWQEVMIKDNEEKKRTPKVNIVYAGSLYASQNLEMFGRLCRGLCEEWARRLTIELIGTNLTRGKLLNRVEGLGRVHVELRDRVVRREALKIVQNADALLFIPHQTKDGAVKGLPSSKLYDYLKAEKPVVMVPSDNDIAQFRLCLFGPVLFPKTSSQLEEALETISNLHVDGWGWREAAHMALVSKKRWQLRCLEIEVRTIVSMD